MQRWLSRPVLAIRVDPGEREAYEEAPGVTGARAGGVNVSAPSQRPRYYTPPQPGDQPLAPPATAAAGDAACRTASDAGTGRCRARFPGRPSAPACRTASRSIYARRTAVPVTRVAVEFDAGIAADPADRLGTQAMMLNMLEEGTTSLNSTQLAEAQERLGATIGTGASLDRTAVTLTAMTPALGASLDLLADVIRNPAFDPGEVERIRQQQLAGIAAEMTQPQGLGVARAAGPALRAPAIPMGSRSPAPAIRPWSRALTRDELIRFHQTWIRPDNATIFAVGDLPLAQLVPLLEARFGNWRAPVGAARDQGVQRRRSRRRGRGSC